MKNLTIISSLLILIGSIGCFNEIGLNLPSTPANATTAETTNRNGDEGMIIIGSLKDPGGNCWKLQINHIDIGIPIQNLDNNNQNLKQIDPEVNNKRPDLLIQKTTASIK